MTGAPDPRIRWGGSFGAAYTDRNRDETVADVDTEYAERFGITQTELLTHLFEDFDRDARILEVGCGVGVQLEILRRMGFDNLYGLDIQQVALQIMTDTRSYICPIRGIAEQLPFTDNSFDVIYTIDLLIHVPPEIIERVLDEIFRCSRRYIMGSEYYDTTQTELLYCGQRGILWKDDYSKLYEAGRNIELLEKELLEYSGESQFNVGDRFRSVFRLKVM